MTAPTGTRGVGYVRVSDQAQDTNRQHESIARWAQAHHLTLAKTIEDKGRRRHQAATRGEFRHLLREIERGDWDWLVVDHLDRLGAGDPLEYMHLLYICRQGGCQVWSATDHKLLTSTELGAFITTGVGAVGSATELVNKAGRDITAKAAMARRGEWTGGYIAIGLCVACITPDGTERWRVLDVGQDQRLRKFPDGREERWDGRGAFPKDRHPGDTLQYRPGDERQQEAVKLLYEWFAEENVSWWALAHRLNKLGYRTPRGPWHSNIVARVLKNPVYTGHPHWSKSTQARHAQLRDGQVVTLETPQKYQSRPESQWVGPDQPLFAPLVPADRYSQVRDKLADRVAGVRAPANPEMWLSGLLYCGMCSKRMLAWATPRNAHLKHGYVCQDYRRYIGSAPCGCLPHHTDHRVVVEYLERYLQEVGAVAGSLADAGEEGLLATLYDRRGELFAELAEVRSRMEEHLACSLGEVCHHEPLPDGRTRYRTLLLNVPHLDLPGCEDHTGLLEVYGWVDGAERGRAGERRRELEAGLLALYKKWDELPTERMRGLCTSEIRALEHQLENLRVSDLPGRVRVLHRSLLAQARAIAAARRELADREPRRYRAAVGRLLERVVAHWEHHPRCEGSKQIRGRLVALEFIPRADLEARIYEVGAGDSGERPPTPSFARMLARTYWLRAG